MSVGYLRDNILERSREALLVSYTKSEHNSEVEGNSALFKKTIKRQKCKSTNLIFIDQYRRWE
jgi:hypothetical protein